MLLIIDASVLIAFYSDKELNEPQLLHALADNGCTLVIPNAVYEEIKKGRKPTLDALMSAVENKIITVNTDITEQETTNFRKVYPSIHYGESQVILLGLKMKASGANYYCLMDDRSGRRIAEKKSIETKGTKGLIMLLSEKRIIEHVKKENLLYLLDHCNFRS